MTKDSFKKSNVPANLYISWFEARILFRPTFRNTRKKMTAKKAKKNRQIRFQFIVSGYSAHII